MDNKVFLDKVGLIILPTLLELAALLTILLALGITRSINNTTVWNDAYQYIVQKLAAALVFVSLTIFCVFVLFTFSHTEIGWLLVAKGIFNILAFLYCYEGGRKIENERLHWYRQPLFRQVSNKYTLASLSALAGVLLLSIAILINLFIALSIYHQNIQNLTEANMNGSKTYSDFEAYARAHSGSIPSPTFDLIRFNEFINGAVEIGFTYVEAVLYHIQLLVSRQLEFEPTSATWRFKDTS